MTERHGGSVSGPGSPRVFFFRREVIGMDANIVELERLRKLGLVLTSSEAVDQLEEIGMSG